MEAILGIPLLGATIILGLYWTPLVVMLVLHIITLVLTKKRWRAFNRKYIRNRNILYWMDSTCWNDHAYTISNFPNVECCSTR